MIYLLYTLHVVLCIFLILVVLLQQGKGADLSVFGGGSTMAAFGARSATNLLHRLTVAGFVGFVLTTLVIAFLKTSEASSVMEAVPAATAPATPAPVSGAPEAAPETTATPAESGSEAAPTSEPPAPN